MNLFILLALGSLYVTTGYAAAQISRVLFRRSPDLNALGAKFKKFLAVTFYPRLFLQRGMWKKASNRLCSDREGRRAPIYDWAHETTSGEALYEWEKQGFYTSAHILAWPVRFVWNLIFITAWIVYSFAKMPFTNREFVAEA